MHLKGLKRLSLSKYLNSSLGVLIEIATTSNRLRNTSNAWDLESAIGNPSNLRFIGELYEDMSRDTPNSLNRKICESMAQVHNELVLKERAILSLEANLVVVDKADAGGHPSYSACLSSEL